MHDAQMKADNTLTMWTNYLCSNTSLFSGKKMTPN